MKCKMLLALFDRGKARHPAFCGGRVLKIGEMDGEWGTQRRKNRGLNAESL